MQNIVDEIKSRLDIVDVISDYIQLKPAGVNFRALCPFHREKTPSFFVSPERQIWHCFGCGAGGDIFSFVMRLENIEFPEALRILANKAGVRIEKQDYHLISQRTKLLDIVKWATKFYQKILLDHPAGQPARDYLKKRGVSDETIKEFQLGFAPNAWETLFKFLTKKGFKEKDIELAGLIVKSSVQDQTSSIKYYDRFRNRIMFPINDLHGNQVGFTGRIMPGVKDEKEIAKYINTPETPIYNKSRILYGLDKAKLEIKKNDRVVLVEGNMDVIACHQAGFKNTVASSGTALTYDQVKILKRYTNNILLAFDVDLAGQAATQRGIDIALEEGMNVKIIQIPEGKDPDECIKENPEIWRQAVTNALPIMEYQFAQALKDKDVKNVEDKKKIRDILLPAIVKLGDPVEQDHWLKVLAEKLAVSESSLRDSLKKIKISKEFTLSEPKISQTTNRIELAAEKFFGLFVKYPDLAGDYFKKIPIDVFTKPLLRQLVDKVKEYYNLNKTINIEAISKEFKDRELNNYFQELFFIIEKEFTDFKKKDIIKEIEKLYKIIINDWLRKQSIEITQSLAEMEKSKDKEKIKILLQKKINLDKQRIDIEKNKLDKFK